MNTNEVILVNEADEAIGRMEKMEAHRKALLHRAFSVFIFNAAGEMLLQQRADGKYHSAGLWTNACCSHPAPGEDTRAAALRRLKEELGFTTGLEEIFSFIYRTEFDNGLTEYEYDHVFTGTYDGIVRPDRKEVKNHAFRSIEEIDRMVAEDPAMFTSWFLIARERLKDHQVRHSAAVQDAGRQ